MTHCQTNEDCAWGTFGTASSSFGVGSSSASSSSSGINVTCNPHTRLCEGFNPVSLQKKLSKATAAWSENTIQNSLLITVFLLLISMFIFFPNILPCCRNRYRHGYYSNSVSDGPHVIDHQGQKVPTKFGPDLVKLQCRHMGNMKKWPYQTMDQNDTFNQKHFQRAFDIAFGFQGSNRQEQVVRVCKYIGGGSFGRVFLAKEQIISKKWGNKPCKRLRTLFSWIRGKGNRPGTRPEGKSVAIKFLPPNSNLSEVHVGCLAFRESALHLGQTLYYTTEVNVWKNPSAPPYPFIVMETGTFKHKKKSHISSLSKTTQTSLFFNVI